MRKLLFILVVAALCSCANDEKKANSGETDPALEKRLDEYVKLTDDMNVDASMDYIYPKLFSIAPREQLVTAMKEAFSNDEVKAELDSVKVTKIFPAFKSNNGQYTKVDYSMIMYISFITADDSTESDPAKMQYMMDIMGVKYGKENVSLSGNRVRIKQHNQLVAAKDGHAKEWSFVSYKEGDPMMEKLFSKEVLDKLATYK